MQQDWSLHELWDSTWSRNFYTILMRFCFELSRLLPRMFIVGHPHRVWWPRMRVAIDDWFSRNGSRWLAKMCVGGLSPFVFCFLLILFVCFFLLLFLHSAFTKRLFFFPSLSLSLSLYVRQRHRWVTDLRADGRTQKAAPHWLIFLKRFHPRTSFRVLK